MKKGAGTLRAGLNAAAAGNKQQQLQLAGQSGTVLIGAHYQPEVRRALYLLQAEPRNAGKKLKGLLGEAINDLCAKYGKPEPYHGEE